jgi:hypothetical protein
LYVLKLVGQAESPAAASVAVHQRAAAAAWLAGAGRRLGWLAALAAAPVQTTMHMQCSNPVQHQCVT